MPKLPTYTAPLGEGTAFGGRRATAEDFGAVDFSPMAAATQRFAANYNAAKEEEENRNVLVKQAEIRAKYSKRLDDAVITGEDLGKIRESLDADLSAVSAGLQTKKGTSTAALHAATTGQIFDNQANNILVSRATTTAKTEGSKFITGLTAQVSRDPSSLKANEGSVDAFVSTLGRISPEQKVAFATEWKQDLNVAAALAQARVDPAGARAAVEAGQYNLNTAQREHVINRAHSTEMAIRSDENYKRAEAQYARTEADAAARDEHFKKIMTGGFSMRTALDDPRLTPQSREHLIMLQEQRSKALAGQERRSDTATYNRLYESYIAPEGTPGKQYNTDAIFEAVKAGKLNTTDAERLRGIAMSQKDENGRSFASKMTGRITDVKAALRGSAEYSNQPELSEAIQQRVTTIVEEKVAELRKLNDTNRPLAGIFDPNSKDFMFTPALLQQAARDAKAARAALLPKAVPVATKADYDALPVGTPYVDSKGNTGVKAAR